MVSDMIVADAANHYAKHMALAVVCVLNCYVSTRKLPPEDMC